jgi:hypothetical protein
MIYYIEPPAARAFTGCFEVFVNALGYSRSHDHIPWLSLSGVDQFGELARPVGASLQSPEVHPCGMTTYVSFVLHLGRCFDKSREETYFPLNLGAHGDLERLGLKVKFCCIAGRSCRALRAIKSPLFTELSLSVPGRVRTESASTNAASRADRQRNSQWMSWNERGLQSNAQGKPSPMAEGDDHGVHVFHIHTETSPFGLEEGFGEIRACGSRAAQVLAPYTLGNRWNFAKGLIRFPVQWPCISFTARVGAETAAIVDVVINSQAEINLPSQLHPLFFLLVHLLQPCRASCPAFVTRLRMPSNPPRWPTRYL